MSALPQFESNEGFLAPLVRGRQGRTDQLLMQLAGTEPECERAITELSRGSIGGILLARLRRLTRGNEDDARDLAQETWFAIWKARGTWTATSPASAFAYLMTTATNACFRDGRSSGRRTRREQRYVGAGHSHSPALDADEVEDFLLPLQKLAPTDREVLTLGYLEGLPDREVAKRLGITPAAAKKRRQAALKRLRTLFAVPP